ncbi:polysaccharide deacetylase family protein [Methanocella sp. MCL-LM]|uniref:polysaccharide deacetylase family protein n=1 Tax=Methanocella sp. MCL-LM TaxID=3412035 RepID=UPI003C790EF2
MRTLEILEEHDIRATFFVVGEVVDHYPGLVEAISERGHEIACHSLRHPCIINPRTKAPMMSINEFKAATLVAKRMLEKASGKKVTGYRAPNALIAGWMIDALEEIGFKYDSSVNVNSFFHKTGSPVDDVTTIPYYPNRNSLSVGMKRNIVEFPWARFEAGLNIPAYGGPILRFLGSNIIMQGLKQSLKRGHTVFYFHPIDISDERFPRVGKNRPGYWMIKGNVIEKRITHILSALKKVNKMTLNEAMATCEIAGYERPVTGIQSEVENILSA